MGNDQAKILVEEYLEVENYPKETRRKVFKHFRKDIEQKNADLDTIVEQLRSGDALDLRRNEEYILRALPDKYELKCFQFLYDSKVRHTRLFQDLTVNVSAQDCDTFAAELCKAAHRVVCVANTYILDLWKTEQANGDEERFSPLSPILIFLREGTVEFVELVHPSEVAATEANVGSAALVSDDQPFFQTLNFPEHRIIGSGYAIETSPLIGDRLVLQKEFVLARALNPDSAARRTRVAVRSKEDTAYGVIRKRDFDQIVESIPAISNRYQELVAKQNQREIDARNRVEFELQRVAHTALINAVSCGNSSDILRAIDAGADVTGTAIGAKTAKHLDSAASSIAIPIHVAAQFAQVESLQLLLDEPSILVEQCRDIDGRCLLGHLFVTPHNHQSTMARAVVGRTALHIACEIGWNEGARILCDHGASIVKQDGLLHSSLDCVLFGSILNFCCICRL